MYWPGSSCDATNPACTVELKHPRDETMGKMGIVEWRETLTSVMSQFTDTPWS